MALFFEKQRTGGCSMDHKLALFAAVVAVAQTAEAVTGFGGTVIAVALGAQFLDLDVLLPTYVPVNLVLSLYIVARHGRYVDRKVLFARILPLMATGFVAGILVFNRVESRELKSWFGVFVAILAVYELYKLRFRPVNGGKKAEKMGLLGAACWLVPAGIIHGIYASGGPLVVNFAARELADKKVFRSTLSALWLTMTSLLALSYAIAGRINTGTLRDSFWLVPSLCTGILAGEWLHGRVEEKRFRMVVNLLLLAAGLALYAGS